MARQVKLPTREMGEIELLLIEEEQDGTWEPEWEPIRGTVFGDQVSIVSKEILDHGFHRWSRPLVDALGISPEGALLKVPSVSRVCHRRSKCPLHIVAACSTKAKNMPWCFEPDGVADEQVRLVASQAIQRWREGVYLVVVRRQWDA